MQGSAIAQSKSGNVLRRPLQRGYRGGGQFFQASFSIYTCELRVASHKGHSVYVLDYPCFSSSRSPLPRIIVGRLCYDFIVDLSCASLRPVLSPLCIFYIPSSPVAQEPLVEPGPPIIEGSRSHSDTPF